ncbi:MAG: hypothetical protein IPG94_04910 [Kineosporiaceae bacterium]|nr:hypothetical protein [Kineosporiaceae bacterium]
MPAKQTLNIKILSCGGMFDLMSEQEASFLNSSLVLFRNVQDLGRARPRANASMIRAYRATDLFSSLTHADDILHLIAHANGTELQVGAKTRVSASELKALAAKGLRMPEVVVSTACKFDSKTWHDCLANLGVKILIAAAASVSPANLAAFDMAFYSALLTQVRKGQETLERVRASFQLAERYYGSIHAVGTSYARFKLTDL